MTEQIFTGLACHRVRHELMHAGYLGRAVPSQHGAAAPGWQRFSEYPSAVDLCPACLTRPVPAGDLLRFLADPGVWRAQAIGPPPAPPSGVPPAIEPPVGVVKYDFSQLWGRGLADGELGALSDRQIDEVLAAPLEHYCRALRQPAKGRYRSASARGCKGEKHGAARIIPAQVRRRAQQYKPPQP